MPMTGAFINYTKWQL